MNKLTDIISILSEYDIININKLRSLLKKTNSTCHLAIMCYPYLDNILNGSKTIESRFSKIKKIPFNSVHKNDIILFKGVSSKIIAVSLVKRVESFSNLNPQKIDKIITKYNKGLTTQENFIKSKLKSKYGTIIFITKTERLVKPIKLIKKDRRAWIIFQRNLQREL